MSQAGPIPVLFMIQHLDRGGSEYHFGDLIRGLDRTRIEPHVIYCSGGYVAEKLEGLAGLPIQHLPITRAYDLTGWRAVLEVRAYLRRHGIRVVVAYHFVADFVSVLATLGRRVPVISSRRDMGFTRNARQVRIGRWLDRGVARYVAVSEAVRSAVAELEHVDPARIDVIHNGLNLATWDAQTWDREAERAGRGIAPDEVLIGCISNFNAVKGHLMLLDAFAGLRGRVPERKLKLLLAGQGPLESAIREKRANLGLEDAVLMPGHSSDVAREFTMSDLIVLPSDTEGFSNTLVQAMAARRAVVATSVGGNPEAVEHEVTGLLVPPKDAPALCAALERLVRDDGLRARMGEAGRARAEQRFSERTMLRATEELILRTVDAAAPCHR